MMNNVKSLLGSSDIKEVMAGCAAVVEIVKVYRFAKTVILENMHTNTLDFYV